MKYALSMLFVSMVSAVGFAQDVRTLVANDVHVITLEVRDDLAVFVIESIADFTNERGNRDLVDFKTDFANFRVDMNANNEVDMRIDRSFGMRKTTTEICVQYLISPQASSSCGGQRSAATLNVEFKGTAAMSKAHPVFEFAVPIAELTASGRKIGVIFTVHSAGKGFAFYPAESNLWKKKYFEKTIEIEL